MIRKRSLALVARMDPVGRLSLMKVRTWGVTEFIKALLLAKGCEET